ncbi:MAG: tyrosine recombinase XerC [Deltaproteobacteria bacterium]|nr:tyrosine recombinase XerC [Deltaproteobacteria bacterium]
MRQQVEDFVQHLRVVRGLSPHTLAAYESDLHQMVAFLEGAGLDDLSAVTTRTLRAFLASLGETAASTRARKLSAVRVFFDWVAEDRGDDRNPARALATPRKGHKLPHVLSAGEADQLAEPALRPATLRKAILQARDAVLVELLYGSGLRVSECVGLDIAQVDLKTGEVRVVGKGNKERVVPLSEAAVDAVHQWLEVRPLLEPTAAQALVLNARGGRLTARSAARLLKARGLNAGVNKDVHPHALRHSFATHLLQGGADLRSIQEMLGHASLSTTQKYTHLTTDSLLSVHRRCHPRGDADAADDEGDDR